MKDHTAYGHFDATDGCFVLTAEPPRKWVNLHYNQIGEHEIYSEISNIGDGVTWCRDGAGNTCTLVNYDGKYLYIRDESDGTVFCPAGVPAPKEVEQTETRYYAAKTVTTGACNGLQVEQRVFVPRDAVCEARTVWVENTTDQDKELSIFMYAMFDLSGKNADSGGVFKDNYCLAVPEINGAFCVNRNTEAPTDRFKAYLVALNDFYGASCYRDHFTRADFSVSAPRILWGWNATGKPGFGPDCAGAVQVKLTVPAGQKARADFLLGQAASTDEVKSLLKTVNADWLDAQCAEQERAEAERASKFTVRTGNEGWDGLLNHFAKKQMYSYLINKSGFRDNLQCDCALALCDYEAAEANLLRALASQYADGSTPHGFRPLNRLQYSDKPAWIFLAVPWLIKESGRMELLDEEVPYFESDEKGTVWDHLLRAMRFLANDTGANGLSDQHHADWNDGLEATEEAGERESVMVSMQLCFGMRELMELAERRGDEAVQEEAQNIYDTFKQRINDVAWDGDWYVRTLCGDGYRIGSSENEEGKIFMNTQSWSVLSGVADEERGAKAMDAVDRLIETDLGFMICAPGFSKYDPRVGRMSNSMPGHVENGGCYNHGAGFKGVADCMLGRAEEAWRTFEKVAPDNPLNPVERSCAEPFSFNNYYSQCEYVYGLSGYPWKTGTAGWFTMLMVEWILGARRHYDGLLIDPCLPKAVKTAGITRVFRGATFDISIDNSSGRCKGVQEITVDGSPVTSCVLTCLDGKHHEVKVVV